MAVFDPSKDRALVNELIPQASMDGGYRMEYVQTVAMLNRLHATRELLEAARDAPDLATAVDVARKWVERRKEELRRSAKTRSGEYPEEQQ